MPISDQEAEKLISKFKEGKLSVSPKIEFEEGDNVRVIDGPFVNFTGTVDDVNIDNVDKYIENLKNDIN